MNPIEQVLAEEWKKLTCRSCGREIQYIGVPEMVICTCGGDPYPDRIKAEQVPLRETCMAHLEPEPCPTCAAYKAAGL